MARIHVPTGDPDAGAPQPVLDLDDALAKIRESMAKLRAARASDDARALIDLAEQAHIVAARLTAAGNYDAAAKQSAVAQKHELHAFRADEQANKAWVKDLRDKAFRDDELSNRVLRIV